MQTDNAAIRAFLSRDLMDLLIRVGLIALVAILCARIFAPFTGLLLWALVLAVALYPLHRGLAARLGGRQGWSATVLVVAGLLLIGVPTIMLGSSFAGHVHDTYKKFENDEIVIKTPSPAVAEWPLATFSSPPPTVAERPLASLEEPPPTVATVALAVFQYPPPTVAYLASSVVPALSPAW